MHFVENKLLRKKNTTNQLHCYNVKFRLACTSQFKIYFWIANHIFFFISTRIFKWAYILYDHENLNKFLPESYLTQRLNQVLSLAGTSESGSPCWLMQWTRCFSNSGPIRYLNSFTDSLFTITDGREFHKEITLWEKKYFFFVCVEANMISHQSHVVSSCSS